jgi:hypothetical protein
MKTETSNQASSSPSVDSNLSFDQSFDPGPQQDGASDQIDECSVYPMEDRFHFLLPNVKAQGMTASARGVDVNRK